MAVIPSALVPSPKSHDYVRMAPLALKPLAEKVNVVPNMMPTPAGDWLTVPAIGVVPDSLVLEPPPDLAATAAPAAPAPSTGMIHLGIPPPDAGDRLAVNDTSMSV